MSTIEATLPANAIADLTAKSLVAPTGGVGAASVGTASLGSVQPLAAMAGAAVSEVPCHSGAISVALFTLGLLLAVAGWQLWPAELGWQLVWPLVGFVWGAASVSAGVMIRERT